MNCTTIQVSKETMVRASELLVDFLRLHKDVGDLTWAAIMQVFLDQYKQDHGMTHMVVTLHSYGDPQ